ncbi:hypothetical protein PV328_001000 [Microctonus aethiopoides]|uniref:Uncharacterized protein n=1 Tax=Microctonus aethiopoides TaxID=144406 RepID=A0AA39FW16_9HYME|nr:hypothetical protein PV328_001000 [Microctonus aethiopoides]
MSHKAFFALEKRTQIALINAAIRNANDNRIEPLLMNEVQNGQLPPGEIIDEVLQAELHERDAVADLQPNDWDNFIQRINLVNPHQDVGTC